MMFLFLFFFFFFSSRRRHTRWNCDWSSDVCSSDLDRIGGSRSCQGQDKSKLDGAAAREQQRSEERRVGKSVDLGGRRIIKKKKNKTKEREESIKENVKKRRAKNAYNNRKMQKSEHI